MREGYQKVPIRSLSGVLISPWRLFRYSLTRFVFASLRDDPMTTEGFKRKLTAILSADAKGYSLLIEEAAKGRTYLNNFSEVRCALTGGTWRQI